MHTMIRVRRFFRVFLSIALAAVLLAGLAWGGYWLFDTNYIVIDRELYRRDITELDLSGTEPTQLDRIAQLTGLTHLDLTRTGLTNGEYEALHAALPDCEILWEPNFQGDAYPLDTKKFTVTTLTEEDILCLDYFTELTAVNAMECRDYDAIMVLISRRPECQVLYQVDIGQREYLQNSTFIRVPDADLAELEPMLQYLPALRSILFTGVLPAPEAITALAQKYPHIAMDYHVEFHGLTLQATATEADFSGIALEGAAEIEAILPYLPNLTKVTVCDCGIPQEEMMDLADRYPDIRFTFTVTLGGMDIRTDVTEFDLSNRNIGSADLVDAVLPYFPDLTRVIMCYCGIGNEEMDALNRKYEDIQIVWSVLLGDEMWLRTDTTAFIPVKYNVWLENEDTYNLRYCTEMVALDLGHMDIANIEFAAYMPHLKYLLVCDSQVSSLEPLRGLQELMYLEIFLTDVTDYSPLLECPALEDLNMTWTYGSAEPIAQMTWLKRLWWGGKWHPYNEATLLTSSLPNTKLVLYDGESTGSGWRQHKHYYEMRDMFGMYYMK